MRKVITTLREQHQKILSLLDNRQDIADVIRFVEEVHHPLEEEVLFPKMAAHPLLQQGGPMCTFFYGLELEMNPKEPLRELLRNLYAKGFSHATLARDFPWLHNKNPLNIPMGEHFLSHETTQAILELQKNPDSSLAKEFLPPLIENYVTLLRAHIDKEERCLFVLGESMFPAS